MKRREFLLGAGVLGACTISGELAFSYIRSAHADAPAFVTPASPNAQLPGQQSVIAAMAKVNDYYTEA